MDSAPAEKDLGPEQDLQLVLVNAVSGGEKDIVAEFIESGQFEVDTRSRDGFTLLMKAAMAEQFAMMEYLVSMGADTSLLTQSPEVNPDQDVFDIVEKFKDERKISVMTSILDSRPFDHEELSVLIFEAIKFYNLSIFRWLLLDKKTDPNYLVRTGSGNPKHTPLIYLLGRRGADKVTFPIVLEMFDMLVSHPDINVNVKGRKKRRALWKVKNTHKHNTDKFDVRYQQIIDRLLEMGAVE